MKYTISEKECDPRSPCIDLNELTSYLILPSKFINTHQRLKNSLEVHYSVLPAFLTHSQTICKSSSPNSEDEKTTAEMIRDLLTDLKFLGIIYPNGKVEELKVKRSAFVDGVIYFYVKRRTGKRVTIKNLPGGTDEKENIEFAVSHRVIQQRLTFSELCRSTGA